jgi:Ca2+/H+ antiporter
MSPTQISEALFAFIVCIAVGLIPGLFCCFGFLGRRAFDKLLWDSKTLITSPIDLLFIVGTIWPFALFPIVAAWVDSQLKYYFPYGGLQPGWVKFTFAGFPIIVAIVLAVVFIISLPFAMRADQARAIRQQAKHTY